MASEIHGRAVLVKIDVGGGTYTLLAREIECRYEIQGDVQQAVNKAASAAAGADYGTGFRHTLTLSGHGATTGLDAALDKIMTDIRAQAKTPVQFIEPNPWDTYAGSVVWSQHGRVASATDFYVISAQAQFDGLPSQATT